MDRGSGALLCLMRIFCTVFFWPAVYYLLYRARGTLLKWEKFAGKKTDPLPFGLFVCAITVNSWLAPTAAYLFCIPLIGFALAREWRALARVGIGTLAGCATGYALTGYPLQLVKNVFYMVTVAPDQHLLSRMLVTEFMPQKVNFLFAALIAGVIAVKIYRKRWSVKTVDNPVFLNMISCMLLGFFVGRFWHDWGEIAAFVWIAREAQLLSEEFLPFDSRKRFMIVSALAGCFFVALTTDVESRWTEDVPRYPLIYESANSADREWFPDSGGIVYNDNMLVFYSTFFYNPHANWRYIMGFEPVLMRPEDLAVYRNIQRNYGAVQEYGPWIKKMTGRGRNIFYQALNPCSIRSNGSV